MRIRFFKTPKGKACWDRNNARRRYRFQSIISNYTADEWKKCLAIFNNSCAYCGALFTEDLPPTQDHIIPISKGGNHTKYNIVPACLSCNCRKGNRDNYEEIFMNKLKNNMR